MITTSKRQQPRSGQTTSPHPSPPAPSGAAQMAPSVYQGTRKPATRVRQLGKAAGMAVRRWVSKEVLGMVVSIDLGKHEISGKNARTARKDHSGQTTEEDVGETPPQRFRDTQHPEMPLRMVSTPASPSTASHRLARRTAFTKTKTQAMEAHPTNVFQKAVRPRSTNSQVACSTTPPRTRRAPHSRQRNTDSAKKPRTERTSLPSRRLARGMPANVENDIASWRKSPPNTCNASAQPQPAQFHVYTGSPLGDSAVYVSTGHIESTRGGPTGSVPPRGGCTLCPTGPTRSGEKTSAGAGVPVNKNTALPLPTDIDGCVAHRQRVALPVRDGGARNCMMSASTTRKKRTCSVKFALETDAPRAPAPMPVRAVSVM
ncbi:hypothetical protein C8R43DRAFT_942571 [Mycena crocata]|nr:hypothetical protein C8R43DRAFT_942571 [Mycena crocata]